MSASSYEAMGDNTSFNIKDAFHISISEYFYIEESNDSLKQMTVKSSRPGSGYYCVRLFHCIQSAVDCAVKSKDRAAQITSVLLDLIPQKPSFPLDAASFYTILVTHIVFILKEREEVTGKINLYSEGDLDEKEIQNDQVFDIMLSHKLDEVIIPIFAEVLVSIDRYSNLDLVRKDSPPHIRQLWLSAFSCPSLCKFSYADMTITQDREEFAGMGQRSTSSEFCCQFPFFWLVKETVDSHWDNAISVKG